MIRVNRPGRIDRGVALIDEVAELLRASAPVAIGVSGGKDSCACTLATIEHLDAIGHAGPRILIHSDLGRVEWRASLPTCDRLATRLGLELVTVRRTAGDMMDRWLSRWRGNVRRYAALECVRLILPWSTPSMRFCTSELKTAVICRELVRRFPGGAIVSAAGIRRDESAKRKLAPIAKAQKKLTSSTQGTRGLDWHPILEWSEGDVYAFLAARGFALHEAYTRYRMTRVSCAFCIMATEADLRSATTCEDNHAVYREQVGLEIVSTFAFQGARWLGDLAPHLLTAEEREALAEAKVRAARRVAAERRIPAHLLYTKGWPTVVPTWAEAELLCDVRREIAAAARIEVDFTEPAGLRARFTELFAEARRREAERDDAGRERAA